jgi:hypothetical protein
MELKGEIFPLSRVIQGQKCKGRKIQKVQDLKPIVFVRFNTQQGKTKAVTLHALLDSGSFGCLVTEKFTRKLQVKCNAGDTIWTTTAGAMSTSSKCQVEFTIPELPDAGLFKWDMYVTKSLGAYGMILGRDLTTNLRIDIQFSTNSISWDGVEIPMKDCNAIFKETFYVGNTAAMEEVADRIGSISEAKYKRPISKIFATSQFT